MLSWIRIRIHTVYCIEHKIWDDVAEAQADGTEVLESMGDVVYFTDPNNKQGPPKK